MIANSFSAVPTADPSGVMTALRGNAAQTIADRLAARDARRAEIMARLHGGNTQTPPPITSGGTPTPAPAHPMTPQEQAFNTFANSAGMQFALQQMENAVNNGYAARGTLQSGAAEKALQDRAAQIGIQDYFMPYMNLLGGQQSVGAQAGSSVAGVGSNFANTAADINAGMGSTIANGAAGDANAALARGLAGANLGSAIGSGLGTLASSFVPTQTYGAPVTNPGTITVHQTSLPQFQMPF